VFQERRRKKVFLQGREKALLREGGEKQDTCHHTSTPDEVLHTRTICRRRDKGKGRRNVIVLRREYLRIMLGEGIDVARRKTSPDLQRVGRPRSRPRGEDGQQWRGTSSIHSEKEFSCEERQEKSLGMHKPASGSSLLDWDGPRRGTRRGVSSRTIQKRALNLELQGGKSSPRQCGKGEFIRLLKRRNASNPGGMKSEFPSCRKKAADKSPIVLDGKGRSRSRKGKERHRGGSAKAGE